MITKEDVFSAIADAWYDNIAERAIAAGKSSKKPEGGDHVDSDAKG
jgi:hypothetical protein